MENNENFDVDAYYKSLEENEDVKKYEKESREADNLSTRHKKEENLGALEALILEGEAAVGFTKNQKK